MAVGDEATPTRPPIWVAAVPKLPAGPCQENTPGQAPVVASGMSSRSWLGIVTAAGLGAAGLLCPQRMENTVPVVASLSRVPLAGAARTVAAWPGLSTSGVKLAG